MVCTGSTGSQVGLKSVHQTCDYQHRLGNEVGYKGGVGSM